MSSDGTKVTTDPATLNNPKNENPGVVTSDSLAAESVQEGGSFGANADSRGPMSQPSSSTTTNNADISDAKVLPAAPDAARRPAQQPSSDEYLDAGLGGGKSAGRGPTYNVPAGSSAAEAKEAERIARLQQPGGKDGVTEGGFDAGAPNASFNAEIGSKRDPGRVALQEFEKADAAAGGDVGPKQGEISNDGQYDVLKETSA